jgi:hypothetical protein
MGRPECILNFFEMTGSLGSLDLRAISGHFMGMRLLILTAAICGFAQGQAPVAGIPKRQLVPMEVMQRAQAPTQKMIDQMVRGNYKALIDQWHPGFVKAISRPYGGPEKFKASVLKMLNQMGGNGIAIQAGITRKPDIAFEVDWGPQDVLVDGKPVTGPDGKPKQEFAYRQWMVYVPTVIDANINNTRVEPAVLEKWRTFSFQIAISPKRNENWTFIDGGRVTPLQLRKIFPFLPKDEKDLIFPKVRREQIK